MKNLWLVTLVSVFICLEVVPVNAIKKTCPKLYLRNGRVRNRPKTFAQFSCNRYYSLLGNRYSKCINGEWDTPVPVCIKPVCKIPKPPKYGLLYPSFREAVVRFFCMPEYTLVGPQYAYCDGDKWSAHLPSCLPSNSTASVSCDFETPDICGWSHDLNHNFEWERMSNKTPSGHVGTGPSYDHTKGTHDTGFYMYIESSTRNENDTARLISPIYQKQNQDACLEFYYHMYGSGIGELRVYLKKINDTWNLTSDKAAFRMAGNQGNAWLKGFIEFGSVDSDFQIIFEGVRGISYVSDIAIDDVKLIENCTSEELTTLTTEYVGMSTIIYESCENRCFKTDDNKTLEPSTIGCDCDENCSDRNSCCVDFYSTCLQTYSSDTPEDTTFEFTTASEPMPTTKEPQKTDEITTKKTISISTTASSTKSKTIKQPLTTIELAPTTKTIQAISTISYKKLTPPPPRPVTSPEMLNISTAATETTLKAILLATAKTVATPRTTLTSAKPRSTTTPTTQRSTSSIIFPTKFKYINDVVSYSTISDEKEFERIQSTEGNFKSDKEVILGETKSKSQPSNNSTVKIVIGLSFAGFVVLGAFVLIKLAPMQNCLRLKKMRNMNGDSQSDVRFLTSDEVLNFNLASDN